VTARDVRDLAPDVMRHRVILSYEAIADGVSPDEIIGRVLGAVDPGIAEGERASAA
jgi:MoxR-like ATPase